MSRQINCWSTETNGSALSGELHLVLGVSHRQAKGLIDAGCVTINGKQAITHGSRLKTGDEIKVNFDPDIAYSQSPRRKANTDSEIKILWEDKDLVFLDKPAGILSVPTEHSDDHSLADSLAEFYRQKGIKNPRVYIAHRLDRYTSGTIVFAKTPEALNGLRELFHDHNIQRVYKAIVVGELPENIGSLHDKLAERTRRLKMTVIAKRTGTAKPQGTKPAVTHYRVVERLPGHTVVELRLETGRRNQIRVQFAERGYPLLGDHIYGSRSPLLDRQALHAELLGLRHPVTDENITVQSRLPEDMEMTLRKLRALRRVDRAKAGVKGDEGIFKPRITKERKQERVTRAKRFSKNEASLGEREANGTSPSKGTRTPPHDWRPSRAAGSRSATGTRLRSADRNFSQVERGEVRTGPRKARPTHAGPNGQGQKSDSPNSSPRRRIGNTDRKPRQDGYREEKKNYGKPQLSTRSSSLSGQKKDILDSSPRPFRKEPASPSDTPRARKRPDAPTPDRPAPQKYGRSEQKVAKFSKRPPKASGGKIQSAKKTSPNSKNSSRSPKRKP